MSSSTIWTGKRRSKKEREQNLISKVIKGSWPEIRFLLCYKRSSSLSSVDVSMQLPTQLASHLNECQKCQRNGAYQKFKIIVSLRDWSFLYFFFCSSSWLVLILIFFFHCDAHPLCSAQKKTVHMRLK